MRRGRDAATRFFFKVLLLVVLATPVLFAGPAAGPSPAAAAAPVDAAAWTKAGGTSRLPGWTANAPAVPWTRVAYGTAAVVALICVGVYVLKKLNHGAPLNRGRYLEVLEARPVGRNVQLILVRVAGRILLLAYGGESVTPVAELSEEELPKSSSPAGGLEGFKALLKRLTGARC